MNGSEVMQMKIREGDLRFAMESSKDSHLEEVHRICVCRILDLAEIVGSNPWSTTRILSR